MSRRLSPDECLISRCHNKAEWGSVYCGREDCGEGEESDAKQRGSEETTGEPGGAGLRQRVEEDECPHCRRRAGGGEIHISNSEGSGGPTVAHVPGVGTISVPGTMSIYGSRVAVTPESHTLILSYRSR